MKLPKLNSFIVGFLCAIVAIAFVSLWQRSGFIGGIDKDSPNGLYSLSVVAPLASEFGGTYNIKLVNTKTSTVVRSATVSVPSSEQTTGLRRGGTIVWDPANSFADIVISGQNSIRIWVP